MGRTRQGKPAREHLYNRLQDLRGNSLRRPINAAHLRRDGSIEPVVDLAAPLSKKEMQEESEKRQKPGLPRKRPTTPSISQAKESLNQPSRPFSCAG
ncbi:hypothetical protein V6N13_057161 [Hibiscus sabdariffa]|uniref:Uncharacterized protein n=1 Tax=Hibiscus sabdariffa TaxID=183260 RepID=A0ABR2AFE7_9ROSI